MFHLECGVGGASGLLALGADSCLARTRTCSQAVGPAVGNADFACKGRAEGREEQNGRSNPTEQCVDHGYFRSVSGAKEEAANRREASQLRREISIAALARNCG